MLYKQFKRVHELDSQIADYHNKLMKLYIERAQLISTQTSGAEGVALSDGQTARAHACLDALQLVWERYGVKLPRSRSFTSKVERALGIQAALKANEPGLTDKLHIVAVPPYKTLRRVLAANNQLSNEIDVEFADPTIEARIDTSNSWEVVVLTSSDVQLLVQNLHAWGENEYRFNDYNCEGMGVREYLAALLQDSSAIADNVWVLLLKGAQAGTTIPCAIKNGNQVQIDTDDSRILLGQNYLQPTIKA